MININCEEYNDDYSNMEELKELFGDGSNAAVWIMLRNIMIIKKS